MAKTRQILSDKELLEYSEYHLRYEVEMLIGTATLLSRPFESNDPLVVHVLRMATIESFGLHLRNLIDFFYPNNARKTDVLADDFFPGRKRPLAFPPISASLTRARERADKELAHLTKERIFGTPPHKVWLHQELASEICKLLGEFVRTASREKLHSVIGRYVGRTTVD